MGGRSRKVSPHQHHPPVRRAARARGRSNKIDARRRIIVGAPCACRRHALGMISCPCRWCAGWEKAARKSKSRLVQKSGKPGRRARELGLTRRLVVVFVVRVWLLLFGSHAPTKCGRTVGSLSFSLSPCLFVRRRRPFNRSINYHHFSSTPPDRSPSLGLVFSWPREPKHRRCAQSTAG